MRKTVSLVTRCASCRHAVLGALASWAGVSLRPILPSSTSLPIRGFASKRAFITIASRRSDSIQQKDDLSGLTVDEASLESQPETFKDENPESTSSLPWYLQVNSPQQVASLLSERQRLPELPPNPPPLLQPIFEHMSIDLGLDDLSLFDLRKIDPPTAFGANLLMIIGTSRSERHLHVSADRFCRWLRHTHKLSPYADGLLGRGELKIKLRRKARRAKLLSSVGSSERGTVDDGLRTGWVCVNLGTIEDEDNSAEAFTLPEGFVGFGGRVKGTKVVVQMLTKEKRAELDLENLWGGALARYERKQARNSKLAEEPEFDQEVGQISVDSDAQLSSKSISMPPNHQISLISRDQQRRSFHSNAGYCASDANYQNDANYSNVDSAIARPGSQMVLKFNSESSSMKAQLSTWRGIRRELRKEAKRSPNRTSESNVFKARWLEAHIDYLQNLPREDALKALGKGFKDFSSTYFLASFFRSFPLFPSSSDWGYRWDLVCYAIDIGHRRYRKENLMLLFNQIRASGAEVPNRVYTEVLKILLSHEDCLPSAAFPTLRKIDEVLQIIQEMAICGTQVPNQSLIDLYVTLAKVHTSTSTSELHDQPQLRPNALQRLRYIMDENGIEITDCKFNLQLLESLADNNSWSGFWAHWRGFAARMQPKSKELYSLMFERLARTKRQADCMAALRDWVPEMAKENPPVEMGEVAKAVMKCLRVAEPDVERDSQDTTKQWSEWVRLWRRCQSNS